MKTAAGFDELLARQKPRSNSRGRRTSSAAEPAPAKPHKENRRKTSSISLPLPAANVTFGPPDPAILATLLALVAFGLVMVFSASGVWAQRTQGNSLAVIGSQLEHAALALSIAVVIGQYGDYRWLRRATYPMLLICLVLLITTVMGFGKTSNGAARWLQIAGFRLQPAEFAKLAVICWLADSLAKKREHIKSFTVGFLPHAIGAGCFIVLCLKQPDFGSAVMIGLLLFVMLFTAGARLGYLIGLGLMALPVVYFLVSGSEYRMKRVTAFFSQGPDNYQLWESQLSFGAGGIWGAGLGNSHQKLMYLPEAHTDFISAIVAEELGLIGFCALICAYLFLIYRGIRAAWKACDDYGTYLCVGIALFIGMQAFTNLAVAVGVVPTKGLVLPFISYGGSSLLVNCIAVGLLSNVSRQRSATPAEGVS
jgi:cell division protein FtsW